MSLIFVDCEADGPCPTLGELTEFGAVELKSKQTFHGLLWYTEPSPDNPAIPKRIRPAEKSPTKVFTEFAFWLKTFGNGRHVFVSDNPAYDWQWINYYFHRCLGMNPFGFSARRLGDFYAGLKGDFYYKQDWKRLRITKHTHMPVDDAMGNVEAFERLVKGER